MKYTNYTNFWLHDLELTSRITHEITRKFFETNDFPINLDEYIILDTLLNNPDLLQMKLANIILKGRAHTGRFLISLENKGFVERIPSKNGQRLVMRSKVTNDGKKIHSKITKGVQKLAADCSKDLPDEMIENLQNTLKQIRTSLTEKFDVKFE